MAQMLDELAPRQALVEIARSFYQRGWMMGTAGNLSIRADDNSFWITASGRPKGQLDEQDFVRVSIDEGNIVERFKDSDKSSAETSIHQLIYRHYPQARSALHGHSVDASLVSEQFRENYELLLPAIEMIKGFDIWEQHPSIYLPLFDNIVDVNEIARDIDERFSQRKPDLSALLIKHHGITVWADSVQQAFNRFEILEFILSYLARNK